MGGHVALEFEFEDEQGRVARFGPMVLMHWVGQPQLVHVNAVRRIRNRINHECPDGTVGVHFVGDNGVLPDADVRKAAQALTNEPEERAQCIALVIPKGGFFASAFQMVAVNALTFMGNRPVKNFRDIPSTAQWLASTAKGMPPLETMIRAMEAFVEPAQPSA